MSKSQIEYGDKLLNKFTKKHNISQATAINIILDEKQIIWSTMGLGKPRRLFIFKTTEDKKVVNQCGGW